MSTMYTMQQKETFEQLLRAHQERLYRYAYRLAGNRDDAEDLLQQSILEAYQSFDRFRIGTHFDRWLYRIMHHSYLDIVRRRPKFGLESLDTTWENDEGAFTARDIADPGHDPEAEMMHAVLSEPLQRALDALPAEFRSVLLLADLQELSYEEVAQTLGCPIGTVRSRLHRARSMMRRSLLGEADARADRSAPLPPAAHDRAPQPRLALAA